MTEPTDREMAVLLGELQIAFDAGLMSSEQIARWDLEAPGWNDEEARQIVAGHLEHDTPSTERELALWLRDQVVAFDGGSLSAEQIHELDATVPGWHSPEARASVGAPLGA